MTTLQILDSNDNCEVSFFECVLLECGIDINNNYPQVENLDDFLKYFDTTEKLSKLQQLYESIWHKTVDFKTFVDNKEYSETFVHYINMFKKLFYSGECETEYLHIPILKLFAKHNPKMKLKMNICFDCSDSTSSTTNSDKQMFVLIEDGLYYWNDGGE
jgi:hypothetical protein